jgi:DNA-binding NarL/FixJ family response regulator
MALSIQIVEKNKKIQDVIDLEHSDFKGQVVTHHNDDEVVALNYATQQQPKIILLNHEITGSNSFDFISFLSIKSPGSRIIVVGNNLTQEQILSCLLAGANGYLEQSSLERFLNRAIESVLKNEVWITRKMTTLLLERLRSL